MSIMYEFNYILRYVHEGIVGYIVKVLVQYIQSSPQGDGVWRVQHLRYMRLSSSPEVTK